MSCGEWGWLEGCELCDAMILYLRADCSSQRHDILSARSLEIIISWLLATASLSLLPEVCEFIHRVLYHIIIVLSSGRMSTAPYSSSTSCKPDVGMDQLFSARNPMTARSTVHR